MNTDDNASPLFVIRFTDNPTMLHVRKEYMQQHLDWLKQHQQQILVAGSLRTEPETTPIGACWIVRAANTAQIEALLITDPFWINGLRASYDIHYWSKAFPDLVTPV